MIIAAFRPQLRAALQGYTRARAMADISAGLTVAVVALPLAMAFAIASGLPPQAGLFTAIIAGFLISALGGCRVQIGGPAGAFIVIVYGIVERYGVANLLIATAMSGLLLFALGLLKLGSLVRFIPVAVIIGFTNGIAVLIALSQVKDFFGLPIAKMPADFFGMLHALAEHSNALNGWAVAVAISALLLIVLWAKLSLALQRYAIQRAKPTLQQVAQLLGIVPGSIVALVLATLVVALGHLPVETIGSRFGHIPAHLPAFSMPDFSWSTARFLLMPIITLALLGAIESLLCARVADGMTGQRHDPNQELMAQGIANFVTPFFGGMPATGTIARTVTNIKSGASSPIAGMVHALTLLVVIAVAAPWAEYIPLAVLAAILLFVAWNMGEWREFARLKSYRMPYRVTLVAVFLLTVIFDLTVAVEFGIFAACITFIYRISSLTRSEQLLPGQHVEMARVHEYGLPVQVWRLQGALFFGATKLLEQLEDNLPQLSQVTVIANGMPVLRPALILDIGPVIYIDSTGAEALEQLLQSCSKQGVQLVLCGLAYQPRDILQRTGLIAALAQQPEGPAEYADIASVLAARVSKNGTQTPG